MSENMAKTTEELLDSSKKILAAMEPLSFEKYAVTKSYENYKKYKTGEKDKIEWFEADSMEVLELLERLGYPMDNVGTYLFKDLITEAKSRINLDKYDESLRVLQDLSKERSDIRIAVACEYLEMSDDSYQKKVLEAINEIDPNRTDKDLAKSIYGPSGEKQKPGTLAYRIAQYIKLRDKTPVIGTFSATTFDDETIEFRVYDNGKMDCPTLNIDSFRFINLKPRFELHSETLHYKYDVPKNRKGTRSKLIKSYNIEEDLFRHLKRTGMIRYSTDMAYLYNFPDKNGYDIKDQRRAFKWAKPAKVLDLQRRGFFN